MSLPDRVGGWGTVSTRRSLTSRLASFSATLPSLDLFPWRSNLTAPAAPAQPHIMYENNKRTNCNTIKPPMTSSRLALLGPMFISVTLTWFISRQQHNRLHLLCSNEFSDGSHGSRMILSATMGTSFHSATYVFWYCARCSHSSSPRCWSSGCSAFLQSLPRVALRRRNAAQPCVTCT